MMGSWTQATCNLDCATFSQIEGDLTKACYDVDFKKNVTESYPHIHGSPVWWDERSEIFVWGEHDYLRRLTLTPAGTVNPAPLGEGGVCTTAGTSKSSDIRAPFYSNGGVLSLSIGGDGSAILWATILDVNSPAKLLAFDAVDADLKLLWSSEWTAADQPGLHAKFAPPTIYDSTVLVPTFSHELDVYSLLNPQQSAWFDITKPGLEQTGWGFADTNSVPWAQGARAASAFCAGKGFIGGQLNGYEAVDLPGTLSRAGVVCNGTNVARHYDSTDAERQGSTWNFNDINLVGWAQASRLADEYCTAPARKYRGGQFDGQASATNGVMGIVCYDGTWYDVPKAQVTLSNADLNLTRWSEAARAANDWCKSRGHALGGRFNGWQSETTFGTVCY
jgi:hypothetical protein